MKTPREILFQRHEAIESKLDAIRRAVIARQSAPIAPVRESASLGLAARFWLELFWSCRRVWTGLAAVWMVLFIVNFSQHDGAAIRLAKSRSASGMMALYTQEEMINELLADRSQPAEAMRPRNFVPKPRSEISSIATI